MNVNVADAWRDCVDADRTREHFPIMRRTKDDNNQPACCCFTLSHWIWMQRATRRSRTVCLASQQQEAQGELLTAMPLKMAATKQCTWYLTGWNFDQSHSRFLALYQGGTAGKKSTWHVWLTSMKAIDVSNKQTNKQTITAICTTNQQSDPHSH